MSKHKLKKLCRPITVKFILVKLQNKIKTTYYCKNKFINTNEVS